MQLVNGLPVPAVKEYLALFTEANKQKVLDFHRPQIERQITQSIEQGDIEYQLQAADFEEQIFADLGKHIDVEKHQLVFRF